MFLCPVNPVAKVIHHPVLDLQLLLNVLGHLPQSVDVLLDDGKVLVLHLRLAVADLSGINHDVITPIRPATDFPVEHGTVQDGRARARFERKDVHRANPRQNERLRVQHPTELESAYRA